MRRLRTALVITTLTWYLSSARPVHAQSVSCPGGLVQDNALTYDALRKCGEPAHKIRRTQEIYVAYHHGAGGLQQLRTIEEWTYDFGPDRLTRTLRFVDGRFVGSATGSYGRTPLRDDEQPTRFNVSTGQTTHEVVVRVGRPTHQDSHPEVRISRHGRVEVREVVTVERWVYDLGPHRLMRILTFENGRLLGVDTGSYGSRLE